MARSSGGSAGVVVAGLTAAALAVIGFFAYQASAAQDRVERPSAARSGEPSPGASRHADDKGRQAERDKKEKALPADSGEGLRVVYALKRQRVWLVGKDGEVARTFTVTPSAVSPPPGTYKVTSRSAHIQGSDGVPVENVVRFASVEGVTVGFSAALDGSTPTPDASRKTGGVREKRADGEAMWSHAPIGTPVVVVP
ncbi:L,D-transpeptidase [Streptomyces albus]|uniref:L,D-transpeptidase n=1 Tax=Streptomyces TaxID=1883 RepID=UPI0004CAE485|nr:L,D-transpeptidase [Streptomyces sp. NRRL F-5639]